MCHTGVLRSIAGLGLQSVYQIHVGVWHGASQGAGNAVNETRGQEGAGRIPHVAGRGIGGLLQIPAEAM